MCGQPGLSDIKGTRVWNSCRALACHKQALHPSCLPAALHFCSDPAPVGSRRLSTPGLLELCQQPPLSLLLVTASPAQIRLSLCSLNLISGSRDLLSDVGCSLSVEPWEPFSVCPAPAPQKSFCLPTDHSPSNLTPVAHCCLGPPGNLLLIRPSSNEASTASPSSSGTTICVKVAGITVLASIIWFYHFLFHLSSQWALGSFAQNLCLIDIPVFHAWHTAGA